METHIKPIMSIIVPVYNTESYLKECLDSLVCQDLTNFEIIIINDGSNDNSEEIIQSYSQKYSFIKSLEQKNKGLGATRNLGISLAKGEYIYFMDSDDYLEPKSLWKLYNICKENDLDALFFDAEPFLDVDNTSQFDSGIFNYSRTKAYGFYFKGEILMYDLMINNNYFSSACLYIIKRSILEAYNLKFIEGYLHEDELFTLELMLTISKCMHVNENIFKRRIRSHSIMTSSNVDERLKGYMAVYKGMEAIFQSHIFLNKETKKIFEKRMSFFFIKITDWIKSNEVTNFTTEYLVEANHIAKKHNYFSLKGFLTAYFYPLYKLLRNLKSIES